MEIFYDGDSRGLRDAQAGAASMRKAGYKGVHIDRIEEGYVIRFQKRPKGQRKEKGDRLVGGLLEDAPMTRKSEYLGSSHSEPNANDTARYYRERGWIVRVSYDPQDDEYNVWGYKSAARSAKYKADAARAARLKKAGRGLGRLPTHKPYTATKPKRKPAHAKKYRSQLERIFSGFGKAY